jgi:hypothetical protein
LLLLPLPLQGEWELLLLPLPLQGERVGVRGIFTYLRPFLSAGGSIPALIFTCTDGYRRWGASRSSNR